MMTMMTMTTSMILMLDLGDDLEASWRKDGSGREFCRVFFCLLGLCKCIDP